MTITPCERDEKGNPTQYTSGRVFTHIRGKECFVGEYRASSIGEVAGLAYLNATVLHWRLGLTAILSPFMGSGRVDL